MTTISVARLAADALEVIWAGELSRAYVRGGLDPAYATPAARDAYVRQVEPELAASFIRGWVECRDGGAA